MAFVTKYGTYHGLIPAQLGRVHYVAPSASYTVDGRSYSASDDHDGLSPERALLTLSQALTNVTASAGEVILLLEGTHSQTATIRVQKAGITIAGVRSAFASDVIASPAFGAGALKSKLSFTGAGAPGLSIEADNVEICFLELQPASGFATVIFRNASPDALWMHDFMINMAAGQAPSLDTLGIDFAYRADTAGLAGRAMAKLTQTTKKATAYLSNFSIVSGGANGNGILTATVDLTVVGGRFHNRAGAWASPFVVATGTGYIYVEGSSWTASHLNGIALPVDGSLAGTVSGKAFFSNCRFKPLASVSVANSSIDNFTAGVASSAECYEGNNATAITPSA
jgi:hypothetical protein